MEINNEKLKDEILEMGMSLANDLMDKARDNCHRYRMVLNLIPDENISSRIKAEMLLTYHLAPIAKLLSIAILIFEDFLVDEKNAREESKKIILEKFMETFESIFKDSCDDLEHKQKLHEPKKDSLH
jgi:hypothetical protein